MSERIIMCLVKDGKPVTDVYMGTARAAYLAAIRELGMDVRILTGRPSEVAMAVSDMGKNIRPVRLGRSRRKT